MQKSRREYVPLAKVGDTLEAYMADKKYYAQASGDQWDVVSWENGELVCDVVILDEGENAEDTFETVYGYEHGERQWQRLKSTK